MSKITVTTIAGQTSGSDANKVKIESGDTLEVTSNATVGGTAAITGNTTVGGTLGVTGASTFTGDLQVGGSTPVSSAGIMSVVNAGNSLEWGHGNAAGYRSTLGALSGGGQPFIGFSTEHGTNANTFRTRGLKGHAMGTYDNVGGMTFLALQNANADNQTPVTTMKIDNDGNVTKPLQPAFHIQGTGSAHTGGQETAIGYASTPTIKYNIGNHGVGGTGATSGRFTCPVAGIYLVSCTWYRGNSGSPTAYLGTIVKKNGVSFYSYWYNNAANYGDSSVGQTAMIQCAANDVLQQYVYGASSDSDPGTTMQIYLLG